MIGPVWPSIVKYAAWIFVVGWGVIGAGVLVVRWMFG
jgi:hypothetical protein